MVKIKRCAAVILAAGSGTRMGLGITKQKIALDGESILKRCVKAFVECEAIDSVTVVTREDEIDFVSAELDGVSPKYRGAVVGGKTRAESAKIGFFAVCDNAELVAIHDAARCLITPEMISRVVNAASEHGAASAASAITDTLKRSDGEGVICETVSREGLFAAQTPQIFEKEIYLEGLKRAGELSANITDDNMIAELAGAKIKLVDLGRENIKITLADDLEYAKYLIEKRKIGGKI